MDKPKQPPRAQALFLTGVLAMAALTLSLPVNASVDPPSVDLVLGPGESADVEKTVTVPNFPPKLDLVLMVDNSGSYFDDIDTIKTKAPDIFDGVRAEVADSLFGLATFVDYPFQPWGSSGIGDYAYSNDQALTADKATWTASVDAMVTRDGADTPESQLEALLQAAIGSGRDVGDPGPSLGDIAPGGDFAWRADTTRVIAITTDASMHTAGDSDCSSPSPPCPFPYPGPTFADTVAALNSEGIHVIAIKAPGATSQMDDLAAQTAGAVTTTDASSTEIVEAIVGALEELTFTVTGDASDCAGLLDVSFDPASHADVAGGEAVVFTETIAVPADAESGELSCIVEFFADDTLIGRQVVTVRVNVGPEADCTPTTNPSGKQVPRAGEKSKGQNEDGFYELSATDDHDDSEDLEIFVMDEGSGTVFGPFPVGTKVKYTQNETAEPEIKKMGGGGKGDAVAWHIIGNGDMLVFAVDTDGAAGDPVLCLVPEPPK